MADIDFTMGLSKIQIGDTINATTNFIIWFLIAVTLALIVWGCFYLLSFKRLVRVRQKTSSGYVIIDTKAREFKTKQGVTKWRFLKWIRSSYLAPPDGHMETTTKGKLSAECIRSIDGVLTWTKRSDSPIGSDVFSSEERTVTIEEFRRAEEYKKNSFADKLWAAAPVIAMVIIFVMLLVFWGDIVEPSAQLASQNAVASQKLSEALDTMASVCLNNTRGFDTTGSGFIKVNQSVRPPN